VSIVPSTTLKSIRFILVIMVKIKIFHSQLFVFSGKDLQKTLIRLSVEIEILLSERFLLNIFILASLMTTICCSIRK